MEVIPPSGLDPRLVSAWRKGFAPPERLSIQDFSAKYISLPASYAIQGAVDLNRSRYMLPVLEALQDPKVRIVAVQAAVQCGKSLLADLFTPWVIVNSCGSILWLTKDEALAKTYAETRVTPVLYGCEPVRTMLPSNRFSKRKTSILFPNSTVFLLGGANEGNVHSLSVRYLILDEAWTYKPGIIEQALARVKAFPHTSKVLVISQGAEDSHDFTALFRRGHCAEWGWTCPHCQNLQPYAFNVQRPDQTWAGVAWDKNELTKPNDRYNLVEVAKTTRLECFHCKGVVTDTPANRRNLNDTGDYVIGNPNADPTIKSFTWQALANIDISFSSVASQYIQAKEDDQIVGNRVPLQTFTQQVLAKPWNPNLQMAVIRAAIAEYDPAKDWADEAHRFFMVDVQADCFWAVCRAWSKTGESRLIWYGKLETIQQVRDKQIELGVKDQKTFVDSANGNDHMRVYGYCVQYGHPGNNGGQKYWFCWNALKGSGKPYFINVDAKGNRNMNIYSQPFRGNPALGKGPTGNTCAVYHFASDTASDILQRHFSGKGPKFLIAKDDPIYNAHMNSEVKRKDTDPKTGKVTWRWTLIGSRENHIRDCEKMGIVAASLANTLGANAVSVQPEAAPVEPTPESTPVESAPSETL